MAFGVMLREDLKQEIDKLSEVELREIAEFVVALKQRTQTTPFWQRATPAERADDFQVWVKQLPQTGISLQNIAFDRGNIYE